MVNDEKVDLIIFNESVMIEILIEKFKLEMSSVDQLNIMES